MARRLLLVLLLAAWLPAARAAPRSTCAGERLAPLARDVGLPEPEVLPVEAGALLAFHDDAGVAAVLWAGVARAGGGLQPLSSTRVRSELDATWRPLLARLTDLAAPVLSDADCAGPPATPEQTAAIVDRLSSALEAVHDASESEGPGEHGGVYADGRPVIAAALAALALYLALLLAGLVRDLRADPRRVALLACLTAATVVFRVLVAPRLPMTAAQSDFVHLDHALAWLDGSWRWSLGEYPPLVVAMLASLFTFFGPSLPLAFATTTLAGALLAPAAFVLAERLDGSRRAALAAGAAAGVVPLGAWFANGVSLETWAALFATAALAHVAGWLTSRRPAHLVSAVLALVLFVHCRPEAFVQSSVLGAALLAVFLHGGGLGSARPRPVAWLALVGASALAAPLLAAEVPYFLKTLSDRPRAGAPPVLLAAAAIVALALAWTPLRRLAGRIAPWARVAAVVTLLLASAAGLTWAWLTDDMQVHDPSRPFVPVMWRLGMLRTPVMSQHVRAAFFGLDERAFPGLFAVAALASLLPSRRARSDTEALGVPVTLLVVAGVVLVGLAFSVSGEVLFQGMRYQLAALGPACALAGVGLSRAAGLLDGPRLRPRLLDAGVLLLALLPAVTHLDVTTNVLHDQQRQYLFARDALSRLPDKAIVLLSDHGVRVDLEPPGSHGYRPERQGYDEIFRTRPFVRALARLAERRVEVVGLSEWLAGSRKATRPVFLLRDLNCYRTDDRSGQDRLCRRARAVASTPPLAGADIPARTYNSEPWQLVYTPIVQPMLTLDLVRLTASELATLRSEVAVEALGSDRR